MSIGLVLAESPEVFAQGAEKDFARYTVQDGLSDNNVMDIIQDEQGYLWVGTEIGLNRFDGHQFENYYQNAPEGFLASSYIRKLIKLSGHRMVISTRNGFNVIGNSDFPGFHFMVPDSSALLVLRNMIWDVVELADRSYAVTTAAGFYVFDTEGRIQFRYDAYTPEDINTKRIFYSQDMFTVSGKDLLIYTENGELMLYRHAGKQYQKINTSDKQWSAFFHPDPEKKVHWISKTQISDHEYIFIHPEDSLIYYDHHRRKRVSSPFPVPWNTTLNWLSNVYMLSDTSFAINGTFSGFHLFNINRHSGLIDGDTTVYLPDYRINCLYKDKEGRLWIGTAQGLLKQILKPSFFQSFSWPVDGDVAGDIYTDGFLYQGYFYASRFSKNIGLVKIDTSTWQVLNQYSFFGTDNLWNAVSSIEMYHPDTLWLGTQNSLLWFDVKTGHYGKVVESSDGSLEVSKLSRPGEDGYAWMCGFVNGHLARYHLDTRDFEIFNSFSNPRIPFQKIKSTAYDAFGDVWISGHALARWNHLLNDFDTLITVYAGPNKNHDDILTLQADENGSLWMHNDFNGLLQYQIKEKKWKHYDIAEGMPSEVIWTLSPVIDHTLWMSCHNSITRMNLETGKMEIYDHSDGVPLQKPIQNRYMYFDEEGRKLYAFYQNTVLRIPVDHHVSPSSVSDLLVESVVINNEKTIYHPNRELHFLPGENDLSIHYTVIDFEAGGKYQFEYNMNDQDTWTSLGDQDELHLTNLSPGQYILNLRATGKTGDQKIKSFTFSIAPPFWKTTFFLVLVSILVLGGIYWLYRKRISQIRQKASLDKLLSQSEMKALHAQMNPHFIFNSLNSIRKMILNHEINEASRYLTKFAHLIRLTLDQSRQSFISLRQTITYLERYIEMEKIRNTSFTCSILVDPSLDQDEITIPPMLIQPFIENAIWHGLSPEHTQVDILVEFKKSNGQLICTVDDNGIGIETSMRSKSASDQVHQSLGISNTRSRIQLLNTKHNLDSSIILEDKSRHNHGSVSGTRVTIRLPLEIIGE